MLAALLGQLLFFFAPFVGLLLLPSWLGLFYLVSVIAMLGHYLQQMRMINNEKGLGLELWVYPISCLLLIYVMLRSAILTLTHYVNGLCEHVGDMMMARLRLLIIFIPFLELTIPTNLRRWKLLHYR